MRLLLVEDNPRLATLLGDYLGTIGYRVDHADTLSSADDLWRMAAYDVLILDLGLPDGDGFELLEKIRKAGSAIPILILTARDSIESRIHGLDIGADDYLLKPFHNDELGARLRALLRRPETFIGKELSYGNLSLNMNDRQVTINSQPLRLSRREVDVLEILLRRSGHIVTKENLIAAVHDTDDGVSDNALEVFMHRLRKKMETGGSSCVVKTIRGVGYMLDELSL